MKKFLFLVTLFTTLSYAKTNEFSIIIDKPFASHLFSVTQDYDRQISAIGFSKSFEGSQTFNKVYTDPFEYLQSVNAKYGSRTHLIKLTDQANLILDKNIELAKMNEAVALLKSPTNGYFVGGHTLDGSILITALDSLGNTLFSKEFGTKNNDRLHTLLALRDGSLLAVGSSITTRASSDALYTTGLGGSDIYVTKVSTSGDILWSRKLGTEYDDEGIDAAEADDGSLVILANTRHNKKNEIVLLKISENGEKIWLKNYGNEENLTPHAITKLKDTTFLVSLSKEDMMHKKQVHLIKIDAQSNILLEKTLETTYSSALEDIQEFTNGTLFGVGYVADGDNTDALVMHIDAQMNMLCQEHYGDKSYDKLEGMQILHNSQIAAVGIYTPSQNQDASMWILKLNEDCTIAPLATNTKDLYEELLRIFANEIKQNLLVIHKNLTIELTDLNLYFAVGAYELTKEQKKFLDSFATKLFTLLQKYQHAIESFTINGHTSSEWGDAGFTQKYLKNQKLSMNRAYATLSYMFEMQSKERQMFLSQIFKSVGYNYRKRVIIDEKEDKEKSRRVSFGITLY